MKTFISRLSLWSETRWLSAIVGLGLLMRLAAIFLYAHAPESDELAYLAMARNLVAGKGLVDSMDNYAFYNMGYAFFVLAPLHYLFHGSLLAFRLANLACGAFAIGMVYLVAREAGLKKPARLLAAMLWAVYLPSGVYGVYMAKENLMIPLMLAVLWCALRMTRTFQLRIAVLGGALFGLLALTGNAALSIAAGIGMALVLSKASGRVRLLSVPVMLLAASLTTAPWLVRNMSVLGAPVMNTNGGFNFYLGNNAMADGMFVPIAQTPRGPTWQALRDQQGELKAAETLKHEAWVWIAGHPGDFAALAVKKLGLFWMPPVHGGQNPSRAEEFIRAGWLIEYLVLVGCALAGLRYVRTERKFAVLWIALLAYSAVHMLFYVIFRYREPIMPVLCVLAAPVLQRAAVRAIEFCRNLPGDPDASADEVRVTE